MPELPDVIVYVEAIRERVAGRVLRACRIISPFVLRTFDPPPETLVGNTVRDVQRIGKRIVLTFDYDRFAVIHPMIAGRFRWLAAGAKLPAKLSLAALDFDAGRLVLTEASQKKRAALHIVSGKAALAAFRAGGLDPLSCSATDFAERFTRESHTLKRTLTDPRLFDGIGNAYSDEILHAARLSPVTLSTRLSTPELERLQIATASVLTRWIERLRSDFAGRFPGPGEITAFRPDFAVHGRFGKPCPACDTIVQRIRYAENETNYCRRCQTEGRVLADRSLSRLLREDWPRTVEELEGR